MNKGKVYSIIETNQVKRNEISNKVYSKKYQLSQDDVRALIRLLNKISFCQIPDLRSDRIIHPHFRRQYRLIYKTNNKVILKEIKFKN